MPPELVGLAEITAMFGVSIQRVGQLAARDDFPEPAAVLKAGRVWRRSDVIAWAESKGRELRED